MRPYSGRKRRTNRRGALLLGGVLFTVLLIAGVAVYLHVRVVQKTVASYAMGAPVSITLYGKDGAALEQRGRAAAGAVNALERQISVRISGSEVDRINQHEGPASAPESAYILKQILPICRQTGGKYDPTLGGVLRLWDFESAPKTIPDHRQIDLLLHDVGYDNLEIRGDRVELSAPSALLDFGSVGKGYACDKAAEALAGGQVSGGVVAVGGSIGLVGEKPGSRLYKVDITDPLDKTGVFGSLHLPGGNFISTSGDYERYIEFEGEAYGHILDARTGMPSDSGILSCTVVADSGLKSDALSTACFLLPPQEGLALLARNGAEGVLVDENKTVYVTDGLRNSFSLSPGSGYRLEGK